MSDMPQEIRPWVVWSEEHSAWWAPGKLGYVRSLAKAGRFTEENAREIEDAANRHLKGGRFNEVAMPDPLAEVADGH